MTYRRGVKKAAERLPSNATVNRDVIETLRPILRRAASHWGARGLPAIAWKDLRLPEPAPRARAYTPQAQAAWLAACGAPERLALQLLLTYGLRFGELFFLPAAFDATGPRLSIEKRKRDVPLVLPLRADDASKLAALVRLALGSGLPHVWAVPIKIGPDRGKLRPLTYHELKGRLERAADRAGVALGRRLHGARHHAGTMAVRLTGSLWLAQHLLGHADPKSTQRYAHAAEEDLRGLVDAIPRNGPGAAKGKRRKSA
jgi:integrase